MVLIALVMAFEIYRHTIKFVLKNPPRGFECRDPDFDFTVLIIWILPNSSADVGLCQSMGMGNRGLYGLRNSATFTR
ncbi:hypothetical protein D3C84_1095630 [compost metagenome]